MESMDSIPETIEREPQVVAVLAHEIKNPLSVILGFVEIMETRTLTEDAIKLYLKTIKRNCEYLLRISSNILDITKAKNGNMEVVKEKFNLDEFLSTIEIGFSLQAEKKGLYFLSIKKTDLPKNIYTDQIKLRQIVTNLLDNAIKYTENGFVKMEVSLEQNEHGSFLVFKVEDTGDGIPKAKVDKIFNPFCQLSAIYKKKESGVGLGLHLSKTLANELGGNLELIDSSTGKGSCFKASIRT